MKIMTGLLCSAALLGLPSIAMAQDSFDHSLFSEGSYFSFAVGDTMLRDHDLAFPGGVITTRSSDGYAFVASGGYDYGPVWALGNVRVELALGFRSNSVDSQSLTDAGTGAVAAFNYPTGHTQVWSLMYNVINDFRPHTGFDPYIGVGIGYAMIDFNNYGASPAGVPTRFIDDDDSQFAYQGMIGFRSQLSPRFSLDVSWHYFATQDPSFDTALGKSVESAYQSSAVMVALSYDF